MIAALVAMAMASSTQTQIIPETPAAREKRMKWFKEARFGMFIHWGVYSVPAGKWKDRTNHAEWIMETGQVPIADYEKWRDQFNPVRFDADEWASLAKEAGVKYVTITTKHHDGFALFNSKHTDWDIMSTPFKRDIMAELSTALRKKGIVQCWYHSIMDWHHPDYVPHRAWSTIPPADASFDRYVTYLHNQVKELLTRYGQIGVMWFDGEWERTWNHQLGVSLYNLCRKLQPSVIVNNRVDVGRGGMAGLSDAGYAGDYGTPEQEVPATGLPGVDWESCITMNSNWGYNAADKNYKSTEELVKLLVDVVSKGGNLLLNVGPKPDGTFPAESVERLKGIGAWMKENGDSIYYSEASPFKTLPWGRCTQRTEKAGTALYLHVFDWPKDGKLRVPGLGNKVIGASIAKGLIRLPVERDGGDLVISIPRTQPYPFVPVVKLVIQGKPIVYDAPVIEAPTDVFVDEALVKLSSSSKAMEIRYTLDGKEPSLTSSKYANKAISIRKDGTVVKARSFHNGRPVSSTTQMAFKKVEPKPAIDKTRLTPGVTREGFSGAFDTVADMLAKGKPDKAIPVPMIELGDLAARENYGARFRAVLKCDKDAVYMFGLMSDDGAKLLIDGEAVVDNDGLHSPTLKTGSIPLSRGAHTIEVLWFNRTGGAALDITWGVAGNRLHALKNTELWAGE